MTGDGWMKKFKAMTGYKTVLAAEGKGLPIVLLTAALLLKIFYSIDISFFPQAGFGTNGKDAGMAVCGGEDLLPGYRAYEAAYEKVYPEREIRIGVEACVRYAEKGRTAVPVFYTDHKGLEGNSIYTGSDSTAEFAVYVEEAGFYDLWLTYCPLKGSDSAIERSIMIDGAVPYREMECVRYDRIWKPDIAEDTCEENEMRERREMRTQTVNAGTAVTEQTEWITGASYDRSRQIKEPLSVYLAKGEHTVSILSIKEPMLLYQILLSPKKPVLEYRQTKSFWDAVGIRAAEGDPIVIEAEQAVRTSLQTFGPIREETVMSVLSFETLLHEREAGGSAVGGGFWKEAGEWIEWEFDVASAGYYHISVYDRQNYVKGARAYRRIMLDGAVPFREMECYGFAYAWRWKEDVLSDDAGTPYVFYLKQGRHTLRMEAVPGETDSEESAEQITQPLAIDRIHIVPAEATVRPGTLRFAQNP